MEQENSSRKQAEKENKSQMWTWILLGVITLIFIGAIVIFFGGWWLYKNKVNDTLKIAEEGQEYVEEDNWLNDLDNYFIDEDEVNDFVDDEETEEPNIINGTDKFVSNEFGFTLNFTDNWSDYKAELIVDDVAGQNEYMPEFEESVLEDDVEELNEGFIASYVFYYPSEEEDLFRSTIDGYTGVFSLDIFRLDDYEAISKGDVSEIGRNNRYIFTYSNYYYPQVPTDVSAPRDVPQEALEDIDVIAQKIETFDIRVLE